LRKAVNRGVFMPSRKIALIFDCDGTIAEDSTTRLLRHVGLKPDPFWSRVRDMEKHGWEPTLAFMKLLVDHSKEKKQITKETLRLVGSKLALSPGIPVFFKEIRNYISHKYSSVGISLGIYVVSGGIDEIIRASGINGQYRNTKYVDDIFAGRFSYDSKGAITYPQWVVSFTEKTKCIFAINKGISSARLSQDSYGVNDHVPPHERDVPLNNMIYIGDGPSDVPCMSFLKVGGCEIFAVYTAPR
jgi:2-hydroxy-3-keto-5-methylthiopentenyl-1-phosphate phosphatase